MTTLAEFFAARGWRRRILVGEPVHIGNGLHLAEWRDGPTGKVSHFGVFRPSKTNATDWDQVGGYRKLHGSQEGWIEANIYTYDDAHLSGKFKDHQRALDYLARTSQEYVK